MKRTLPMRVKKKLISSLKLTFRIRRKVVSRFVQTLGYIIRFFHHIISAFERWFKWPVKVKENDEIKICSDGGADWFPGRVWVRYIFLRKRPSLTYLNIRSFGKSKTNSRVRVFINLIEFPKQVWVCWRQCREIIMIWSLLPVPQCSQPGVSEPP